MSLSARHLAFVSRLPTRLMRVSIVKLSDSFRRLNAQTATGLGFEKGRQLVATKADTALWLVCSH